MNKKMPDLPDYVIGLTFCGVGKEVFWKFNSVGNFANHQRERMHLYFLMLSMSNEYVDSIR